MFSFFSISTFAQESCNDTTKLLRLDVNGKHITFRLEKNKAAEEFYNKLPISVFMEKEPPIVKGYMRDSLSSANAEIITTSKGGLYYYPINKQIYFVYDMSINTITLIPLAKQKGQRRVFDDVALSTEVTFSKIEP